FSEPWAWKRLRNRAVEPFATSGVLWIYIGPRGSYPLYGCGRTDLHCPLPHQFAGGEPLHSSLVHLLGGPTGMDPAHHGLAHLDKSGIFSEVSEFMRISIQIKKLWPVTVEIDKFPFPTSNHSDGGHP